MKRLNGNFLISRGPHYSYDHLNYDYIILDRLNISLKLNHKQFWRGATVIKKMIERKRL